MSASSTPELSVVVPLYNECDNLRPLLEEIQSALVGYRFEVIFVDDGSDDGSYAVLRDLVSREPDVSAVRFHRNFGKGAALEAGFRAARGNLIATLDADLQDDPREILWLLARLDEGFDLVTGWKQVRLDSRDKIISSRLFNWLAGTLTGVRVHDTNCGIKVYRRAVTDRLRLRGQQYRLIPALAHWQGFRVGEKPVAHRERLHGRSKFGALRIVPGLVDLTSVVFITRFTSRPLHLFGVFGAVCLIAGALLGLYLTAVWLMGQPIGTRPALLLSVLLMVVGVQFVGIGLLGEILASSYSLHERHRPFAEAITPISQEESSQPAYPVPPNQPRRFDLN